MAQPINDNAVTNATLDVQAIRERFPILHQEVNGKPLVYFDNAATNQKPDTVIESLDNYYRKDNSNIHRGAHTLADRATAEYEDTRKALKDFVNANEAEEIIFTRGTTEGINLVVQTYGRMVLAQGDEVIISAMEHHSNIVPWQMLCEERGAILKVIPITDEGEIIMEEYLKLLSPKTKIVATCHASNALGTVNPVEEIIAHAHKAGAKVLIDGAQSCAHLPLDVQALDVDFFVGSAHKMYGPTGTGFLYGKRELLEAMPPFMGGGEMIKEVTFEKTTYNDIPYKFEPGTPNIGDVIAFKKAVDFINETGKETIAAHEEALLAYATEKISAIKGVTIVGQATHKVGVLSFVIDNLHHFDVGMMLDAKGVAVRTGHHCTQPLMARFGLEGTVRASFAVYNTKDEVDTLIEGVERLAKLANR
ncbi:cysteine desulfurase [Fulvitalea axinellae]|uniref:Cysteine desulfurase n=1 Tax=Fulvitalea axinellae TaxID=1182444 RepID=A0AAU9CT72_9BACT|nr:cysteine desulfurase [Fulvitalea axinellae]